MDDPRLKHLEQEYREASQRLSDAGNRRSALKRQREQLQSALAASEDPIGRAGLMADLDKELEAISLAMPALRSRREESRVRLTRHRQWASSPQGRRNLAKRQEAQ